MTKHQKTFHPSSGDMRTWKGVRLVGAAAMVMCRMRCSREVADCKVEVMLYHFCLRLALMNVGNVQNLEWDYLSRT